jgi:putative ABC transport system permease protein
MDWRTGVRQAFDEFGHHKLRTTLTLLGMIFGVGAVIGMLSIGEGAEREALSLIDALGLRNVIVEAVDQPEERLKELRKDSLGLSMRDLEVALDTVPHVARHSAVKTVSAFTVFSDSGRSNARVLGVSPTHFEMSGLRASAGRLLDAGDERRRASVAVIGAQAARDLYGTEDVVGRLVKVNHVWLRVVGVLAERGLSREEFQGVRLLSPSNDLYAPLATTLSRFRFRPMEAQLDAIHFEVDDRASIGSVAATVSRLIATRHGGADDFRLIVPEELLEQQRETQRIFDVVMASIAGISLFVGGIGIMNIMLATVLERTREIGIRRALGARRADIRRQFLFEACTISLCGGVAGIAAGFLIAWGISTWSGWPFAWSLTAPVVAVGVCALVGIGFGLYPAMKAARLDPIEALARSI